MNTGGAPLRLRFISPREVWLPSREGPLLGAVAFAAAGDGVADLAFPGPCITLPPLAADGPVVEAWYTDAPVEQGEAHGIRYRCSEQFLFGWVAVREADLAGDGTSALQQAAGRAYASIFALLAARGYPHAARFWNYFPRINADFDGLERYRHFNIGRHEAFAAAGRLGSASIPAACALGSTSGDLVVCFLAARRAAQPVENPRQTSAWRYPQEYGPRSPTFARASLLEVDSHRLLLVSGTSSIVGHRTVHAGDVRAQTRESIANLEAVFGEAGRLAGTGRFTQAGAQFKVYVRNRGELDAVRAEVERWLGGSSRVAYLQADICRADLDVEIEAMATADA